MRYVIYNNELKQFRSENGDWQWTDDIECASLFRRRENAEQKLHSLISGYKSGINHYEKLLKTDTDEERQQVYRDCIAEIHEIIETNTTLYNNCCVLKVDLVLSEEP